MYVRGYSIGFTHDQIESGLLWSIKHIYQSLFEEGQTIYLQATTSETLERLAGRSVGTDDAQVNE